MPRYALATDFFVDHQRRYSLGDLGFVLADTWNQMKNMGAWGLSSTARMSTFVSIMGLSGSIFEVKDASGNVTERWPIDQLSQSIAIKMTPAETLAAVCYAMGIDSNSGDYATGMMKLQPWEKAWLYSFAQGANVKVVQRSAFQQAQLDAWCATKQGGCGDSMGAAVAKAEEKAIARGDECSMFDVSCKLKKAFSGLMPNYKTYLIAGVGILAAAGVGFYFFKIAPAKNREKAAKREAELLRLQAQRDGQEE